MKTILIALLMATPVAAHNYGLGPAPEPATPGNTYGLLSPAERSIAPGTAGKHTPSDSIRGPSRELSHEPRDLSILAVVHDPPSMFQECVTLPDGTRRCFQSQAEKNLFLSGMSVSTYGLTETARQPVERKRLEPVATKTEIEVVPVVKQRVETTYVPATRYVYEPAPVVVYERSGWYPGKLLRRVRTRFRMRRQTRYSGRVINRASSTDWTWPGGTRASLDAHMSGWPHYKDTSGMSYRQVVNQHNADHERIGPVSGRQLQVMNRGSG